MNTTENIDGRTLLSARGMAANGIRTHARTNPMLTCRVMCSGAGTIFGQGWQNRERQIVGFFIEFGPRFCPRNKRSLIK